MSQFKFFDGHNDTLRSLYLSEHGERSFFTRSDKGHIDLPRAIEGNLCGGFFAINAPSKESSSDKNSRPQLGPIGDKAGYELPLPREVEHTYAREFSLKLIELLKQLEFKSGGQLTIATDSAQLHSIIQKNSLAAIMHFEGAEAISPDLSDLEEYYNLGLRSIGITWSRSTAFGHGVPFKFPHSPDTGDGLTDAGMELVKACHKMGIMVDLSHLNEKGFWDVAKISSQPLVVSHSAAHALCQSTRNLTDRQIDAVGESGGIIGVNFCVAFIREDGMLEQKTPISEIIKHINYIIDRIGIDHVGLGSDFDGAEIPDDIRDVSGLPKLASALVKHGFEDDSIRKISCENWLRVISKCWM